MLINAWYNVSTDVLCNLISLPPFKLRTLKQGFVAMACKDAAVWFDDNATWRYIYSFVVSFQRMRNTKSFVLLWTRFTFAHQQFREVYVNVVYRAFTSKVIEQCILHISWIYLMQSLSYTGDDPRRNVYTCNSRETDQCHPIHVENTLWTQL